MNPMTIIIIYFNILMGPTTTMSSTNLLLMWVGLEMSLLPIVPLLINKKNPHNQLNPQPNISLHKQQLP